MTRGVFKDMAGKKFGRWTVLKRDGGTKPIRWICLCECGIKRSVSGGSLRDKTSTSCGCINYRTTHGLSKHYLYTVYYQIIQRCGNPNAGVYKRYGGRGIKVCKKWREDFKIFYDWAIANGWKKGLQIDRRNNDGNYCPSNCRFVTPRQNMRNIKNQSRYGHNIYKEGNIYRVQFKIGDKNIGFGSFKSLKEAQKRRNEVAREIS